MSMTGMPTWVELRVHGVSGTPPEALLAHPHVAQVDGGDDSRFMRPVDAAGHEIRGADGQVLEGYHWGHYTSGSWQQALWLILLPFGLINASQFMLPAAPAVAEPTRAGAFHSMAGAMLRFLALLLTLLMTFGAGLTLIDLVAWRWAPHSRFFASFNAAFVCSAGIALTALVVIVLYVIGHGYGKVAPRTRSRTQDAGANEKYAANLDARNRRTPLASEAFYMGNSDAPTLRMLHLAAGLLLVTIMGRLAHDSSAWGNHDPLLVIALITIVVVIVSVTLLGDPEGSVSAVYSADAARLRNQWHELMRVISLLVTVFAAVLVALAVVLTGGFTPTTHRRIEAYDPIANSILYFGVGAVALLGVACLGLMLTTTRSRPVPGGPAWHFRPYAAGMTSFLVGTLAMFVGVGFSAAVATVVSSSLGLSVRDRGTSAQEAERVGVTPMIDRVAYAWGLTLIMLVILVLVLGLRRLLDQSRLADRAAAMFERAAPVDPGGYALPWARRVVSAMWVARLKNHLVGLFWTVIGFGLILSLFIVIDLGPCGQDRGDGHCEAMPTLLDLISQPRFTAGSGLGGVSSNVIANLGAWALVAGGAGLVLLARLGLREQASRRGINVIWDVIAFWPHAVHPFVPRPYSQRAVSDLTARIRQHLQTRDPADRAVVICGHSQGSLISFAALSLLDKDEQRRIALLTFGSQLRLIFSRAFPAYMNFEAITALHDDLGGAWINLYRETDPLAGPVLSWAHRGEGEDARSGHFPHPYRGERPDEYDTGSRVRHSGADWRLLDPAPRVDPEQTGPVSRLFKHSDFWLDPAWRRAIVALHRS